MAWVGDEAGSPSCDICRVARRRTTFLVGAGGGDWIGGVVGRVGLVGLVWLVWLVMGVVMGVVMGAVMGVVMGAVTGPVRAARGGRWGVSRISSRFCACPRTTRSWR